METWVKDERATYGGVSLDDAEERMLLTLDEQTPPKMKIEREERLAESIAEDAGLANVGAPDARMAAAMRTVKGMIEKGYVELVKHPDAQWRIRLTLYGERVATAKRVARLKRDLEHTRGELAKEMERHTLTRRTAAEIESSKRDIEKRGQRLAARISEFNDRPWWRRIGRKV